MKTLDVISKALGKSIRDLLVTHGALDQAHHAFLISLLEGAVWFALELELPVDVVVETIRSIYEVRRQRNFTHD